MIRKERQNVEFVTSESGGNTPRSTLTPKINDHWSRLWRMKGSREFSLESWTSMRRVQSLVKPLLSSLTHLFLSGPLHPSVSFTSDTPGRVSTLCGTDRVSVWLPGLGLRDLLLLLLPHTHTQSHTQMHTYMHKHTHICTHICTNAHRYTQLPA